MNKALQTVLGANKPRLAMALAALGLALGLGGCEQGNSAVMVVRGNMVPQLQQTNGISFCSYTTGTDNYYLDGTMDLAVARSFRYYARVVSKLAPTGGVSGNSIAQLRADGNLVTLTNVHVTMTRQPTDGKTTTSPYNQKGKIASYPLVTEWDIPTYAVIEPGGEAAVPFDLVPAQINPNAPVGDDWRVRWSKFANRYSHVEQVVLTFRLEGTTAEGVAVTAGEVPYPVSTCWGCLLMMTPKPEVTDPEQQWQQCSRFEVAATFSTPCQPGVNEGLPCGYYCQMCTVAGACDTKFCPPLD